MAVKYGRRSADSAQNIGEAVGKILSCGSFFEHEFSLPSESGAQLSMMGDIVAYGNGGGFDSSLKTMLRDYPFMEHISDSTAEKLILRGRFTVLCGDCDRSAAVFESVCEAIRLRIARIVVVTDSAAERENLFRSLMLMCKLRDEVGITEYRADDYDFFVKYKSAALVYGFLTSTKNEVLVLGRDSFARKNNIINRESDCGNSLSSLIARARPLVFTSSATVKSGRTLCEISSSLNPIATVIFSGEVKRLRDAVIYEPTYYAKQSRAGRKNVPEQLGF